MIQDRISFVEKHFGHLCDTMSSITRKCARLRDKGDELAKNLVNYTEAETMNPSIVRNVSEFASNISTIQDYRQAQVMRLETKVVQPLMNYGIKCKQTKNDLKAAFAAQDREQAQKKKLEQIRQKSPGDRNKLSLAETELQKASVEASRISKALQEQADKFEVEKLKDLKKIMTDFVNIEMAFHAKSLEIYTQCFNNIAAIDIDEDIEEFRSKLIPPNSAVRMTMVRSNSYSSLNSNGNSSGTVTPPVAGSPNTQNRSLQRQQSAPVQQQTTPTRSNIPSSPARSNTSQKVVSSPSTPSRSNSQPNAQQKKLIPVANGLSGKIEDDDDDDDDEDDEEEEDEEEDDEEEDDDDDEYDDETTEAQTERSEKPIPGVRQVKQFDPDAKTRFDSKR